MEATTFVKRYPTANNGNLMQLDGAGRQARPSPERAIPRSKGRDRKWLDFESLCAKQEASVVQLQNKLLGTDPLRTFAINCEKVMADWNSLKSKTALPNIASSSDPRILQAFRAVDNIICGRQGSTLLRRLAYVQLMRLFTFLECIISFERKTGRVTRGRYQRDASIALDIYTSAQENRFNSNYLRRELQERKRAGRSWKDLSKPSPLLVLMYSEATEAIM